MVLNRWMLGMSQALTLSTLLAAMPSLADGPPCKVGDVVRAGATNRDARILEHNKAKGLYRVKSIADGLEDWLPARQLKTCTGEEAPAVTEAYFPGTWRLVTGGGGAYVKKGEDYKVIGLDVAKSPPLTIRADGSYTWVIDSKTTLNGHWHVAASNELKYGYEKRGLTLMLEHGESDKDWLVSRDLAYATGGGDAILIERRDLGLTYRGHKP